MSDSQDKSDDLIAELAKLMASNAQGSESEPKPSVIKLTPLSDATVPPPAPIRIPGMEAPAAPTAVPPKPAIRIPGMERPAGVDTPAPTAETKPQAEPEQTQAPDSVPPAAPASASSAGAAPARSAAPGPVAPASDAAVQTPSAPSGNVATPPAAAAPAEPEKPEASTQDDDGFKFDFGFGSSSSSSGGSADGHGEDATKPDERVTPAAPASAAGDDPIADLIAAELDAAQAVPAEREPPKPSPSSSPSVFPPSVEAVPARNFGNTSAGQAPVLVARPAATHAPQASSPAPTSFGQQSAPKSADSDKFAVAPVFGLGARPAPQAAPATPPAAATPSRPGPSVGELRPSMPQPAAVEQPAHDADPMDEIESLIGEAVRVELSSPDQTDRPATAEPQRRPEPPAPAAPVVPPLTTGFAPRRAGLKDNEPQVRSAEAAILAAAAATGAEVGRINSERSDDRPYRRSRLKAPKAEMFGSMRQYVGMAVAGTLLLAAGFGLYWVLGMGRGTTDAPVLTADPTPVKQAPVQEPADTAEPARSVVFNEIDGVSAVDDAETLVSRDETEGAGASAADVARVVTPETSTTETGLANRKVRTVTVRPDGTIVSGDEAVAGTEVLPVERPNVPVVPGASVEPSDLLAAVAEPAPSATEQSDPIAAAIAEGEATPTAVAAVAPAENTAAVFDGSLVAPVPMPRPVDRSALNAGSAQRTTSLDDLPLVDLNEPVAQPVAAVTGGVAAAYVQLSSQRSEAEAQASLQNVQSRFGSLFGGTALEIQRADLGQKGIYYRVRLPASSLQEATQICASIKANGGDCFATNG